MTLKPVISLRLSYRWWLSMLALSMSLLTSAQAVADFETDIAAEGGKWARYYEQEDLEGLMTL